MSHVRCPRSAPHESGRWHMWTSSMRARLGLDVFITQPKCNLSAHVLGSMYSSRAVYVFIASCMCALDGLSMSLGCCSQYTSPPILLLSYFFLPPCAAPDARLYAKMMTTSADTPPL